MGEGAPAAVGALSGFLHYRQCPQVDPGIRYTALQTFDAKGDAWGWLDRERWLIDRGDWTPLIERFHAAEEERRRRQAARRPPTRCSSIAVYGSRYLERADLAATSWDRYRQLFRFYILAELGDVGRGVG